MNRQYGALSGVAIVLIVVNHAIHFSLELAPVDGIPRGVLVVLQALGVFAVPAFLFVSGAFLAYAASEYSVALIRANLARLLWPYAVWSIAFYAVLFAVADIRYSAGGYLKNLAVGYPYHFVPLLAFWYLTAPLLVWILRRRAGLFLGGLAAYQILLLAWRFPGLFISGTSLPAWFSMLAPPVLFTPLSDWAIYFPLGLAVGLHATSLKARLERLRPLTLSLALACFLLGLLNAFGIVDAPWARFAAPLPLMLVLPTITRAAVPFVDRLELLGRRSYGIYLAHYLAMFLAVSVAQRAGLRLEGQALVLFPAVLLVGLGAPLLMMRLVGKHGLTRPAYRYVFGAVAPPLRRAPAAALPALT
jgi:surface polysaccharide O-acyltransferase-like enzyme